MGYGRLELSLALLLTGVFACPAWSHETQPDWPTAEQLAQVTPAIGDSIPIARKLIDRFRHRMGADQLETLDQIHHHLEMMRRVDAEQLGAVRQSTALEKTRLVDYFRWRAEQTLLKLLHGLKNPSIVELDFRNDVLSHTPDQPISINRTDNLLLLRVVTGKSETPADPIRLISGDWDLASERPTSHFEVRVSAAGTNYVLLDLKRLPGERTTSHISFIDASGGETLYTYALTFQAAPVGQLAIDVVDHNDDSIPVLMRISAHESGTIWEPAEAVDLRSVLNDVVPHLSPSGRGYMFYLPGKRRGRYWIVKPPLEMPLPVGKWDITVLRGLEYSPERRTVNVEPDTWTRLRLQPRRWTNMPERGWYSGDDHVHAQLLTSEDARKLLDYARAVDINVANILEMGDVMRTYYPQRGFGKEFRVQHGNHWLIPGQEDPRSVLGHAIGLNLQAQVRDLDRYLSNEWVAAEIHRQGGLYGHTHVGPNACFVHREMALFTPLEIVDFNSIMQADLGTELYYDFLNLGFKMTASAGADTPYGGTIGAVRTYAYTGNAKSCSPDEWFAALQRGRTFVTNGPMLEFRVDDALPGDELTVSTNKVLTVTAKTWGDAGESAPARLRIVKLGEPLEEVIAKDDRQVELAISTKVEAEHGFWIAAHAISRDGAQAHTTPIYVKRDGFRQWNVVNAQRLIEKQLAVLDEIESEVRKSERQWAAGLSQLDYWTRRTAEQADQVRERVKETRSSYHELQRVLKFELAERNKTLPNP